MDLIAIDPGSEKSAVVEWKDGMIVVHTIEENKVLLDWLACRNSLPTVVIEMVASYGMAVGAEVFETCVWVGRFMEASGVCANRMFRSEVKMHLCGNTKAKDGNIRQRLIDIYGGGKGEKFVKGTKKAPGPLYGFAADQWQALALGVTYGETKLGWKVGS